MLINLTLTQSFLLLFLSFWCSRFGAFAVFEWSTKCEILEHFKSLCLYFLLAFCCCLFVSMYARRIAFLSPLAFYFFPSLVSDFVVHSTVHNNSFGHFSFSLFLFFFLFFHCFSTSLVVLLCPAKHSFPFSFFIGLTFFLLLFLFVFLLLLLIWFVLLCCAHLHTFNSNVAIGCRPGAPRGRANPFVCVHSTVIVFALLDKLVCLPSFLNLIFHSRSLIHDYDCQPGTLNSRHWSVSVS